MPIRKLNTAERLRGCVFHETFVGTADIAKNGGTVTGALEFFRDTGAFFDGINDYISYPSGATSAFASGFWSGVVEFTPGFDPTVYALAACFLSGTSAARTSIEYQAGGTIKVYTGNNTEVLSATWATYGTYWNPLARNVLVATCSSGSNTLWLNGIQIATSATVWTAQAPNNFNIGADSVNGSRFRGSIHSIRLFCHNSAAELFTAQEAADYYTGTVLKHRTKATCRLDFSTQNVQVDRAAKANDVPTTEKLADNDMEAAGIAAWTVGGAGAVVQKAAGSRPGGTGTQILQVERHGAQAMASQVILTIGTRYRLTGWGRGDGVASWPRAGTGAVSLWSGTASTTWRYVDLIFTATNTMFMLFNSTDDGTAEFDDFSVTRTVELLSDGRMEQNDTDQWTAGNNATLTKSTATPYAGTQLLRVAYNGTASPYAGQTILTMGKRYRVTGAARGDGTYLPTVQDGAVVLWTGTNSTSWQTFSVDFTATTTGLRLQSSAVAAGNCCFDNCMVVEMSARARDTSGKGNDFLLGDGTTVSTWPTKLTPEHGVNFNGTSNYLRSRTVLPNSTYSVVWLKTQTGTTEKFLADFRNSAGSGTGWVYSAVTTLALTVSSGTRYVNTQTTTTLLPSIVEFVAVTGITLEALDYITLGARYDTTSLWVGDLYYFAIYPLSLTPIQVLDEYWLAVQSARLPG